MQLADFNKFVKLEYPEWTGSYQPFIAGRKTACNAILINPQRQMNVIAIYSVNRSVIKVFIKKKSGDYLYGDGSGAYVPITQEEFEQNIITR
jgi:translation elongation factor P/translation initiation factor 5A